MESSPDLSMLSNAGADMKLPRATTFPTMATQLGYQAAASDSNIHQSYVSSQNDISGAGTPDSSSTTNSLQANQNYQLPQQQVIPDLNAMMFPSTDPFAYPNQPMMEFDSLQQKREVDNVMGNQAQNIFMMNNNGNDVNTYDHLEGQLFGPLPPYLLQAQANENLRSAPGHSDVSGLNGYANPSLDMNGLHNNLASNGGGMNFDEIFGNDGWNDFRQGTTWLDGSGVWGSR